MIVWTLGTQDASDDQRFVEEIYNKYKLLMFSTARKYVVNISDQEDIIQTALERLIKIISTSDSSKRCITVSYIVYTVRSVSIDFLRKQGRDKQHCVSIEDEQFAEITNAEGPVDDLILPTESADRLNAIWPRLPADDRILLEGKYIFDHTDEELAIVLNCKSSSIRMKLTRARRRALKLLSKKNGGDQV